MRDGEAVAGVGRFQKPKFGGSEVGDLDFLIAFGQEFSAALAPPVPKGMIVPQDAYEVWLKAFGADPSPEALAALTDAAVEQLRTACACYFECPALSQEQVRRAVSRTLARWPAESSGSSAL
jgi:hypothetical protein